MSIQILKDKKVDVVINYLLEADRRRNHVLVLVSCYVDLDATKRLILKIINYIKVSECWIYLDRKEAIRLGEDSLTDFISNLSNQVNVNIFPIADGSLFHAKAYALLAFDDNDTSNKIIKGTLVAGSANMTNNGLIKSKGGNIELLFGTKDIDHISDFYASLCEIDSKIIELSDLYSFKKLGLDFKYALLSSGKFIHQWPYRIAQFFSVKYILSEKGKASTQVPELSKRGFKLEAASISKQYFEFDMIGFHADINGLKQNYGIETYLGHWIPTSAVNSILERQGFDIFKQKLFEKFSSHEQEIRKIIQADFESLSNQSFIETNDTDTLDSFFDKVEELKRNDTKLQRLFIKLELFDLPYDLSQKEQIEELYDELLETVSMRKNKNSAMHAVLKTIEERDFSYLENLALEKSR